MRRVIGIVNVILIVTLSAFILSGCSKQNDEIIVNVASRNPFDEIWDAVNNELKDEHIKVVNKAYDSANLNELLVNGDIDMNVAQHYAYLQYARSQNGYDIEPMGEIHISTVDLYSKKYNSVEEIPDGATISVPNDYINTGRALLVLEKAGVIKLRDNHDELPLIEDISENPKHLKFVEIQSSTMVQTLEDVDAGFVYSMNAVDAGLDPEKDPIVKNSFDLSNDELQRKFVIVFTVRSEDVDNEVYKKVVNAYHSEAVKKVYDDIYKGQLIPAWDVQYSYDWSFDKLKDSIKG